MHTSLASRQKPISDVWRKVRVIGGRSCQFSPPDMVRVGDRLLVDGTEVSEALASQFQSASSSANYEPAFLQTKPNKEVPSRFQ